MLLPLPYPDESIGSIIVRAVRHSGIPAATLAKDISPRNPLGLGFLTILRPATLAHALSMDAESFLLRHTLARVCLSFVRPSVAIDVWRALISDDAITRTKDCWPFPILCKFRRYCPTCVIEDLKTYGESYWHLSHHGPGVAFCVRHGVELLNAPSALYRTHFEYDLTLPHEVRDGQSLPKCKTAAIRCLHEVAVEVLQDHWPPRNDWPEEFRLLAQAKGFMPDKQRILTKALAQSLCDFYGAELLCSVLPSRATYREGNLFALAALSRRSAYLKGASPISCLLLYGFLKSDAPETFYKTRRAEKDSEYAQLLQGRIRDHMNGEPYLTAQELLETVNGWGYYRHFRHDMPLTREAIKRYTSATLKARRRLDIPP